jgi:hypothetical protein
MKPLPRPNVLNDGVYFLYFGRLIAGCVRAIRIYLWQIGVEDIAAAEASIFPDFAGPTLPTPPIGVLPLLSPFARCSFLRLRCRAASFEGLNDLPVYFGSLGEQGL